MAPNDSVDESTDAELVALESELDKRWPETVIEPSLARIAAVTDLLGSPQRAYPVLHIAGTNGKSSTVRMIDALIARLGPRVGRYTSPHLQKVTERISLDGAPISSAGYLDAYREVEPYVSLVDSQGGAGTGIALSKFEVLTAMAFAAFADAPVDLAVIETGLGGSWDATNVADGAVATICPIAVDHVAYLGGDIAGIAAEKAGIIKPGSVAVLADQLPDVAAVLAERCAELDVSPVIEGRDFGVAEHVVAVGGQQVRLRGIGGEYDDIFLPVHGRHQARNAALALASVEAFFGVTAGRGLDADAVRDAFGSLIIPGRLERVRSAPAVFLDAAHNPHGIAALAAALTEEFAFRRLIAVLGVMGDKDVEGIVRELHGVVDEVVVTSNGSPRAMPADDLATVVREVFEPDQITVELRLAEAVDAALELAGGTDAEPEALSGVGIVVTGSVVTAGQARDLFGKEPA